MINISEEITVFLEPLNPQNKFFFFFFFLPKKKKIDNHAHILIYVHDCGILKNLVLQNLNYIYTKTQYNMTESKSLSMCSIQPHISKDHILQSP